MTPSRMDASSHTNFILFPLSVIIYPLFLLVQISENEDNRDRVQHDRYQDMFVFEQHFLRLTAFSFHVYQVQIAEHAVKYEHHSPHEMNRMTGREGEQSIADDCRRRYDTVELV